MNNTYEEDMREQNAWENDYEYGYSRRDPNVDPAFNSMEDANAQFFISNI